MLRSRLSMFALTHLVLLQPGCDFHGHVSALVSSRHRDTTYAHAQGRAWSDGGARPAMPLPLRVHFAITAPPSWPCAPRLVSLALPLCWPLIGRPAMNGMPRGLVARCRGWVAHVLYNRQCATRGTALAHHVLRTTLYCMYSIHPSVDTHSSMWRHCLQRRARPHSSGPGPADSRR